MEGGADDFKTEDADDAGRGVDLRCDHLGQEMEDIVGKGGACHTVLPHNVIGRRIPREDERSALCRCTKCRTDGCCVTPHAAEDEERMVGEVAALVWHQCPDGYYPPDERTGPVEEHFRTTWRR